MRTKIADWVEDHRVRPPHPLGSDASYGVCGAFVLPGPCGCELTVISAGGDEFGWEHVSVSTPRRTPNWKEMCFVKNLFFDDEECVVQFHVPKSRHINNHPYCLHLWRPVKVEIPLPPEVLV